MAKETIKTCPYCGGKIEWAIFPDTIFIEEKKPHPPITKTPVLICSKCGRPVEKQAVKKLPPLLEDEEEELKEDKEEEEK